MNFKPLNDTYVVFGETSCNDTDSNYTYANALTLDLMKRLADVDTRFDLCTQADIVNLALVLTYGFVAPEDHDEASKKQLRKFVDDFDDFRNFAIFAMNSCRRMNVEYNSEIDDIIEKEAV